MLTRHEGAFGGGRKGKTDTASDLQKKSKKKKTGGQGTVSVCKTVSDVCGRHGQEHDTGQGGYSSWSTTTHLFGQEVTRGQVHSHQLQHPQGDRMFQNK